MITRVHKTWTLRKASCNLVFRGCFTLFLSISALCGSELWNKHFLPPLCLYFTIISGISHSRHCCCIYSTVPFFRSFLFGNHVANNKAKSMLSEQFPDSPEKTGAECWVSCVNCGCSALQMLLSDGCSWLISLPQNLSV